MRSAWLAELRDDERQRATARFRRVVLHPEDRIATTGTDAPTLGVVLAGRVVFSVEHLYARTEGANAVILIAALLFQAVYLRRFYRRLTTLVAARYRRN